MGSSDVTLFFLFVRTFVIFFNIRNAHKSLWVVDHSIIFVGKSFSNIIQVQSRILTLEKNKIPKLIKKSYSINLMYPADNGNIFFTRRNWIGDFSGPSPIINAVIYKRRQPCIFGILTNLSWHYRQE